MTSASEQAIPQPSAEPCLSTQLEDALTKHQHGRSVEAAAAYARILENDPGNCHALRYLGALHLEEKRFSDAATAFERIRDHDPTDVAALWHLADAYQRMGRTADLHLTYKELVIHAPDTLETCILFAERFFQCLETSYALSFVHKALKLDPDSGAVRHRLGRACGVARESLLKLGRSIEAITVLRKEVELLPNDVGSHRLLCQTLGDAGLTDEALSYLKALAAHAAESATEPSDAMNPLGQFGDDKGRGIWSTLPEHDDVDLLFFAIRLPSYSLAEAICSRLLTMFPDAPALSYLAAIILRERSRASLQKSAAILLSLEKSYRNDARYCFDTGLLHRDQGNNASALIWLTRARMQSAQPEPRLLHELGKTHLALGEFADAAQWLKQAIALKPDLYNAYVDIHEALLTQDKAAEAMAVFDVALRTNALANLTGVHVHPALMSGTADFILSQERAARRGIPAIILNSLGNAGSTYLMLRLTAGLRIPAHSFLLGQYDTRDLPIPSAVTNMAKGGAICRQHFEATDEILSEFQRCEIHEMVLQILRSPPTCPLEPSLHRNALRKWRLYPA